jgi:flagellar basal-body rod protein FlgB
MIDALFNQSGYVAAKKMLDATVARQEAIASNMANIETPGYKRIDLAPTFELQLQKAVSGGDVSAISTLQPQFAQDAKAIAVRRDGNTVQLETELMHQNQNYLAHSLETQLITGSLLKLRLAITGHAS